MGRKRADLVAATIGSSREAIWAEIRRLKKFTAWDVRGTLGIDTVREYLRGLERAGHIERCGHVPGVDDRPGRRTLWQLVNDVGVHAPRVRETGDTVTQGASRDQMWRTMHILKEFTWRDLAIQASTENNPVNTADAKSYVKYLYRAGYLRIREPGAGPIAARYSLIPSRYTGPKAPQVQRVHQVFDPNLGKVTWTKEGGDVW